MKILAILLALLAVAALAMAVVLGIRPDPAKNSVLAQPGVIEEFKKSAATAAAEKQTSPLVAQAQKLEKRINPPQPKPADGEDASKISGKTLPPPPPPAKFDLVATCVNPLDPGKSYALLNQPGKGFFWVKPGDEVNRVVIKKILDGKVVATDGREYAVPRIQRVSLLKPGSPVPPGYENYGPPAAVVTKVPAPTARHAAAAPPVEKPVGVPEPDTAAYIVTAEEKKATVDWIKQMMANPESMGLTKEEVAQLGDLGQTLQDFNSLPTRPEPGPQEPNAVRAE